MIEIGIITSFFCVIGGKTVISTFLLMSIVSINRILFVLWLDTQLGEFGQGENLSGLSTLWASAWIAIISVPIVNDLHFVRVSPSTAALVLATEA
jgi:hypothetical protein